MNEQHEKSRKAFSIQLPPSLLEEIEFLFLDGDGDNWAPENVTYRFKNGPLECPFYPGFYYIPGYSRYVVNRSGTVITVRSGKVLTWTRTASAKVTIRGGYVMMNLIRDTGVRHGVKRHRVLALTFLSYTVHPANFVVNHLNGCGGDDRLENLEFCTYSQNTQHAYDTGLYSNKMVAVEAWNWATGETRSSPTVRGLANGIGISEITLAGRLSKRNGIRYPDGWRIKKVGDKWDDLDLVSNKSENNRTIVGKCLEDNAHYIFEKISVASKMSNLEPRTIQAHCARKTGTPSNGWLFRYIEEFTGWPEYSEKELAIFRDYPLRPSDGVEVYDLETNQTELFTSTDKAAERFGLSKITVNKLARYEGTKDKRYKFRLVRIRKQF